PGADDCRRADFEPDADALHNAGGVSVSGSLSPVGPAQAGRSRRAASIGVPGRKNEEVNFAENSKMRLVATNALSRTAMLIRLVLAGTTLLLGACAVGPDYTRPSTDVGLSYKEQLESGKLGEQMVGAS